MAIANATFIGTDAWNVELYGSLSISSRLSAAISSRTMQFKVAAFFYIANLRIESFLNTIDKAIRQAEEGKVKAKSVPVTPEGVRKAISGLMNLYEILDNIHHHCMRNRLNNVSRLAIGLDRLRRNADRIEELAAWLDDSLTPDFKDAFIAARVEFENGETVPASEVCR